jgi:hypothetical protein
MAVGSFADGNPALPANYTITATGPGGLYSYTPNPGAGFSYTFVIVDNATGLIKAIDASADLSNASNYPFGGNYTVYGLSYSNAVSAATLNGYAGTSFAAFRDAILFNPNTFCGSISQNNTLVTITAVLNAQMLPLTANKIGNAVHLKWTATSSENSSYFEVWRSANGITFDELTGTVPAHRTGSSSIDYEINDNFPFDNLNYYRVKHVDKNGNATWGNIASINMQQSNSGRHLRFHTIQPVWKRSAFVSSIQREALFTSVVLKRKKASTSTLYRLAPFLKAYMLYDWLAVPAVILHAL